MKDCNSKIEKNLQVNGSLSNMADEEIEKEFPRFRKLEENIENDNPGLVNGAKESKLKRGLDLFGCLFVLNICFTISCIPIFTIGASLTALYSMMFRIQRREDDTVVREYFQDFKANFKKGTLAWFLIILAGFVMTGEYLYICNFEGFMATFYRIALVVEIVLVVLGLPFVFPLLARYDNSVINTFKNSLLLSISNIGAWAKIFVAWVVPIVLGIFDVRIFLNIWYLWVMLIVGVIAYGTSLTAAKVFKNVVDVQQKAEETKDEREAKKKAKEEKRRKKATPKKKQSIKERMAAVDEYNTGGNKIE